MPASPEPFPLLEPREAIDYFRAKGFKTSFAWQDVWQEEHARAFTVAKAMRRDILETIRAALDDALAKGLTLEQFRAQVTPLLQAKGWWGRQKMIDPATGQARMVQLGSPRRLKIIYDMNMRMAQAAGRWNRIQRTKEALPYLRYTAVMDDRTRPEHAEWNGTILHVDDPWWDTHYPPCGWNCRCTVIQLDADTIADNGWEVSDKPPAAGAPTPYENPRTGEVSDVPAGIDPGFAYNVGKAWLGGIEPPPLLPADLPDLEPGVSPAPKVPPGAPEPEALLPADVGEQAAIDAFVDGASSPPPTPRPIPVAIDEVAPAHADLAAVRDGARRTLRSHKFARSPAIGIVRFTGRGLKKLVNQSARAQRVRDAGRKALDVLRLRASPAVSEVLRTGVVEIAANVKTGDKAYVSRYARISAPVRIDGADYAMTVVAEELNDGWSYYYHELKAPGGHPDKSGAAVVEKGLGFPDARNDPKLSDRPVGGIASGGRIVTDVAGWPLPIGAGWFRDVGGRRVVPAGDRRRVLGLVGRAIAAPREIRWRWVTGADGKPMLFRRYIAEIGGLPIVVDVGRAGWRFATARDAGFDLDRLAVGAIVWTRDELPPAP